MGRMSFFHELYALEGQGIDLIEILGQDDVIDSPAELAEIIARLRRPGEDLYSELLYYLTYRRFSPEEASRLWRAVMKHKRRMSEALGRGVAFRVAALDYLSTRNQKLRGVRLIAKPEFDNILSYVNIDEIAAVYNRRYFNEVLGHEVHRARRYGGPLSLLMLDVDNFKYVNDKLGHLEGDSVLRSLGRLLCQQTRHSDTVCRFGGDEFAVVLPQTEEEHAYQLAERMRGTVKEVLGGRKPYAVTVSIGGASYPDGCDEAEELVKLADQMCLAAKRSGKDQVRMRGRNGK
jgi:diguanylate cyclase (GGDEF)-like protein